MNYEPIIRLLVVAGSSVLIAWSSVSSGSPWLCWLALSALWELLTIYSPVRSISIAVNSSSRTIVWALLVTLVSHRWLIWLHPIDLIGVNNYLSLAISLSIWLSCGMAAALLIGSWSILATWIDPHRPFSAFVLSGTWGITEVLLAKGPLFWIGLGISSLPYDRALASFAALGGSGMVAAIQLLIGWSLWQVIINMRKTVRQSAFYLILWLIILTFLHTLGYFQLNIISSQTQIKPLAKLSIASSKVLIWQPAIATREKFQSKQQLKLLSELYDMEDYGIALSSPLMVGPEGTVDIERFTYKRMSLELLIGGFHQSSHNYFTSILHFHPEENRSISWVDKRRMVPLGEWLPLQGILNLTTLPTVGGIGRGDSSRLLVRTKENIVVAICYEISDGTILSAGISKGAKWLLVVANLDPYRSLLQKQFLGLSQIRAIETGRWVLSVGNTGPSLVIDATGIGNFMLPPFLYSIGIMELRPLTNLTPYDISGEWLLVLVTFGAAIGLVTSRSIKPPPSNTLPR
uniref:Possible apolipoprotein n-acyltransferase n=1 Tax=Paulinella chromatophora TaxID=39717 RepID=B1X3R2_PAUCH|nr:possible apolipoprotein n-acyltransferase [Paulinella chromatophora]ACB42581.1 possible apolipoprotein n-acyltransferase [Paulinella chromatophora]